MLDGEERGASGGQSLTESHGEHGGRGRAGRGRCLHAPIIVGVAPVERRVRQCSHTETQLQQCECNFSHQSETPCSIPIRRGHLMTTHAAPPS
ncbi:hypothetical protein HUN59_00900, partial [Curtobacterium sp. Csp2]